MAGRGKKKNSYISNSNIEWYAGIYTRRSFDDNEDFDAGYCDMARQMTAADIQQMARILLQQKNRIEITMLSE